MNCLGKYLGVPLTGRAPRKSDFHYLVNKVKSKLASWKAKQLSFAGKVTLVKSVIEAIPIYPMLSTCALNSCLKEIQRLQRAFICGDQEQHRNSSLCALEHGVTS